MGAWVDPATGRTFAAPGGSEGVADDWIEARGFRAAPRRTLGGAICGSLMTYAIVERDGARLLREASWELLIRLAAGMEAADRAARA